MSILIHSPLSISITKGKQFILNLNNYRNAHFQTLNKSKINYKQKLKEQIENEIYYPLSRIGIIYIVHKGDNRRFDIGNICSVHQKYFEDALTELGKIPDDKSENIPITVFLSGDRDKGNPRVDIRIYDLKDKYQLNDFIRTIREGI